jgi:ABC-type nitrate/sulfonate/bicarbonate transport system substrate-binding protein
VTAPSTPARIALMWRLQSQFAGYALAAGEDPAIALVPRSPERSPLQLVRDGAAEFGVVSPAQLLAAGPQACAEVVFVALFMPRSPIRVVGVRDRPGDAITGGRRYRVGVWTGEDLEVRALLQARGVQPADVEFVGMGDDVGPLLDGDVDLLQATTYEEIPQLLARGLDPDGLVAHRPAAHGMDVAKDGLVVRADVLAEAPEVVDRVVGRVLAGWRRARQDPGAAVEEVLRQAPALDRATQLAQLAEIESLLADDALLGFPSSLAVDRAVAVHRFVGSDVAVGDVRIDTRPWERARG